MRLDLMQFVAHVSVLIVHGSNLGRQVFLSDADSRLQSLALRLVLHVFVAELHHLPAEGLQFQLLAPSFVLDQRGYAQGVLQATVALQLLSEVQVSLID